MQPNDVNNLKMNVYATMAYFDVFDYPLTISEIRRYLLWREAEMSELWTFLNNDQNIQRYGDFYFFKGRREIVDIRRRHEEVAKTLWKKARRFLPLAKFVPFIRMVAVCNTLAINNTGPGSDIDLFIVTRKGRLFFARTLITLLYGLLGVRRHGKKVAGRFCLSFYVSDDALNLESVRMGGDDIYLPFWLQTLKPVYGKETWDRFLDENKWTMKYFPRRADGGPLWDEGGVLKTAARLKERLWEGKTGDRIELWLAARQYARHRRHLKSLGPEASVVINERILKFHNMDRRREYAEKFRKRFEEMTAETRFAEPGL